MKDLDILEPKCLSCRHRANADKNVEKQVSLTLVGCLLPTPRTLECLYFESLKFESPGVSKNHYSDESKELPAMKELPPVCQHCPLKDELCPAEFDPENWACESPIDRVCFSCDELSTCTVLDSESSLCEDYGKDEDEEDEANGDP
jgi:hypothetical protein